MFGICGHTFFPPEVTGQKTLKTVYEWSQLEFEYDGEGSLQSDLISKFYIPGASTPIDMDVYYGRKFYLFLSVCINCIGFFK